MTNSWDFANYFNAASINGGGSPIFDETALSNIQKYMNGEFTDPSTPEYYGTTVDPDNNRFKNYVEPLPIQTGSLNSTARMLRHTNTMSASAVVQIS